MKIKKNQKQLTRKQLEIAVQYAKDKIERYLSPTQWEEDKQLEVYVNNAYKVAGRKLPERIIFFDSPEKILKHQTSAGASVGDSVWSPVRESVRDSVGDAVWDSVWNSVWVSVWTSVWISVGSPIWTSVRTSAGASVRACVGAYWDADIFSFYGFFNDYFEKNKLLWLQLLSENTTGYMFYEKECWLVRKPMRLTRDERGRLHNETEKAIEWKDGYGFYFLHGGGWD